MKNDKIEIKLLGNLEIRNKIDSEIKNRVTSKLYDFYTSISDKIRYCIGEDKVVEVVKSFRDKLNKNNSIVDFSRYYQQGYKIKIKDIEEYLEFEFNENHFVFINRFEESEGVRVYYDDYNIFLENKGFNNDEEYVEEFIKKYKHEIKGITNFMLLEYISKQAKYIIKHKRFYFTNDYIGEGVESKFKDNSHDDFKDIDLSDTKGTEKIIMLHKLGVLDFLKDIPPFKDNVNSLASAISGFTGIDQKNVYPMINQILKPLNDQKNNPLNSQKKVDKINKQLALIGFKQSK